MIKGKRTALKKAVLLLIQMYCFIECLRDLMLGKGRKEELWNNMAFRERSFS